MRLEFEVGDEEQHTVVYSWNQFTGRSFVTVDGVRVVNELRVWSPSLVMRYQLTVGVHEQHEVVIEKHRKRFNSAVKPQACRAYVDGQLVAGGSTGYWGLPTSP
jgi:hypothetical protein